MQTIKRLRREQCVGAGAGAQRDEILELAEPAVEGVLLMAQKAGLSEPEVGYEIQQDDGEIIAQLELA